MLDVIFSLKNRTFCLYRTGAIFLRFQPRTRVGNFFMLSQGKKREKEEKKGRKRREEREEKKRERKERREERKERKKERRKKKEREKEEEKKEGKERRKDKTLVTKNLFGGSNVECDIFLKQFMPK